MTLLPSSAKLETMDEATLDSLESDTWPALPPGEQAPLTERRLQNAVLVLQARGLPFRTERFSRGWLLRVPPQHFDIACLELSLFEKENTGWPPPPPAPLPQRGNSLAPLCVLLLLATFHNLTRIPFSLNPPLLLDWVAAGDAHAGNILAGQWWRPITALCLHTDGLHLLGNLVFGALFIIRLCRGLGAGLAWSLILASGISGNLLNALLQTPDHRAIGASTAVFGAIALVAGINLIRYRSSLRRRWVLPLAAALALLALLGAEGERTDVGAHLLGFASGLFLGILAEFLTHRFGRPKGMLNALLALSCVTLLGSAWYAALF